MAQQERHRDSSHQSDPQKSGGADNGKSQQTKQGRNRDSDDAKAKANPRWREETREDGNGQGKP
jgi:hypothetical protein